MSADWRDLLKGFVSLEWQDCADLLRNETGSHIYVLAVERDGFSFPLYAGQTRRLHGRVSDYQVGQFQAPTDFRVGQAVKYLRDVKQCGVRFLYKPSEASLKDEKVLIRELLISGCILLNFLGSFDYSKADPVAERQLVHRFCDMISSRGAAARQANLDREAL